MKKIIRRILHFLVTGALSLFLAACYGMPAAYKYFTCRIAAYNESNQPIPDLKIALSDSSITDISTPEAMLTETHTDTDGIADIAIFMDSDTNNSLHARITDTDGTANGGLFKMQDLLLENRADITVHMEKETL